MRNPATPTKPVLKPDPQAVALLRIWFEDMTADEVRRFANSPSPSIRQAAVAVLAEFTGEARL